ncbi:PREDICTED: protein FAM184B [Gavialis gangeticus]|uniref:protein FAM184B n=1 Tax=Gavialis gangeticus TaxID=94835 RepID=UPI00092E439C|nr:PREDICTED: protein FAM184B [Gavialis gangeticus]
MASGASKSRQPGTCNGPQGARCSPAEECSREMHTKMCKKIAQLTKVIYALNTKNDEHEASIQALKEAHEEEIKHIHAETMETILQYKSKMGEEQVLRKRIQTLEDMLGQHQMLKEEASAKFIMCKKQVAERELRTEGKQPELISFLSRELLDMKTDFENKLQHLNQESESLVNDCKTFERENLDTKESLDDKHRVEMQVVLNEMENLKSENRKIIEEYAEKTSKLRAFYEKEKDTLKKAMQQSVADMQKQCQQREMEQRKINEAQEAVLLQQVKKLEADLEAKSQKINELKKHSQKLKEKTQDLEIQLRESKQDILKSKSTMKKLEEELPVAKDKLILQENEILRKAEGMETIVNAQCRAANPADELKDQIVQLQQKTSTKESHSGKKDSEDTKVPNQSEDPAATMKDDMKQWQKEELRKIKRQSDEEKMRLKEQLVKGLEDLVKKHTLEIKSVQASMEAERKTLQKELQLQLEELRKKSENEIKQLQREKEALSGKLQDSSLEVSRLQEFISQNQDLPKFSECLQTYSRKIHKEQDELDSLQSEATEVQSPSVQHKDISKLQRERGRCQETPKAQMRIKSEEKPRLESTSVSKKEDRQSASVPLQKEKTKHVKPLQEEWHNHKADLEAQVAQLKQALDQQAHNFKDALQKHNLQSNKEKEKLLQDLQDIIKQSQNVKVQLEASNQRALKKLEKNKNQELKEIEERLKREYNNSIKIHDQSHRLEIRALEEKTKNELQGELEKIQKQQTQLLESLRMDLSEQQESCASHRKQIEDLQMELKNVWSLKQHQEGNSQNQIKSLNDDLEKCQNEISGLKKENSLLKDTMELLSAQVDLQKQEAAQLQDREKQHRRLLEDDLKGKHKKELDVLKQDHCKEIQNMVSDFSSAQAHLQAKNVSLETELKELEEKSRKRESRQEDMQLISCLQDKLSEREEIIRHLMEGRKFHHSLLPTTEVYRNRSFSFNPSPGCLTPSMKKKKLDDVPSRVVSVPNLASYAKSFLSCDLRSKRSSPQITKSTSLDQSPSCIRACYQSTQSSDSSTATRKQDNEASKFIDDKKQDPRHQEWFTKYFSF